MAAWIVIRYVYDGQKMRRLTVAANYGIIIRENPINVQYFTCVGYVIKL